MSSQGKGDLYGHLHEKKTMRQGDFQNSLVFSVGHGEGVPVPSKEWSYKPAS